ncbi:MAG TPA: leucyl/phenylalanyl-tRNA--protein transferase [Gammaproteobacteria bacterium]|nr:leucyl/phenylalanyl-tRNA--protein transferase [Gammaproteobacteria bacterium]
MIVQSPYWIEPGDPDLTFPDVSLALREPDGLLAVGGDLTSRRILSAYRHGVFPWYSDKQPILWWSPDPRTVIFPARLKISRSLRKTLRSAHFEVTMNRAFPDVIKACAEPRPGSNGTWITAAMADAYSELHTRGSAHSVECWLDGRLAGGLYGIAIGRVFFGESMFSRETDASKVAFSWLVRHLSRRGFGLIDCQVYSAHLASLGAEEIARADFVSHLDTLCETDDASGLRAFDADTADEGW